MTLPNQSDVTSICTAPFVELLRDGESVSGCTKSSRDGFGYASSQTFWNVPSFRNLTLLGLSDCGKNSTILGHDTILNASSSLSFRALLGRPVIGYGTGTHLVLDGKDMAMIRATIVNVENSALVSSATNRIEFKVRSGPGMYSGCSNGDASSHEWMKSNSINAHGGLAHFFVRVSVIVRLRILVLLVRSISSDQPFKRSMMRRTVPRLRPHSFKSKHQPMVLTESPHSRFPSLSTLVACSSFHRKVSELELKQRTCLFGWVSWLIINNICVYNVAEYSKSLFFPQK